MDSELKRFEEELERLSPGSMPEGLIARMEAAMENWESEEGVSPDPVDKVVPFPRAVAVDRGGAPRWAAAAAVAVLGALTAVFLTSESEPGSNQQAGSSSTGTIAPERAQPVVFAPEVATRKVLRASDEGMLDDGRHPMGVMRYDYVDRVVFRNELGEELHMEVPSVGWRVFPLVTD